MKKVRKIFNRIANADPMIWGYVMLNDNLGKKETIWTEFASVKAE